MKTLTVAELNRRIRNGEKATLDGEGYSVLQARSRRGVVEFLVSSKSTIVERLGNGRVKIGEEAFEIEPAPRRGGRSLSSPSSARGSNN